MRSRKTPARCGDQHLCRPSPTRKWARTPAVRLGAFRWRLPALYRVRDREVRDQGRDRAPRTTHSSRATEPTHLPRTERSGASVAGRRPAAAHRMTVHERLECRQRLSNRRLAPKPGRSGCLPEPSDKRSPSPRPSRVDANGYRVVDPQLLESGADGCADRLVVLGQEGRLDVVGPASRSSAVPSTVTMSPPFPSSARWSATLGLARMLATFRAATCVRS
jgi:hypothetical protein